MIKDRSRSRPWPGAKRLQSDPLTQHTTGARTMSKQITSEMPPETLPDQRALKAWKSLWPRRGDPGRIEILKSGSKRAVCRLGGVGLRSAAVIAKRSRKATGFIERTIYEQVLPHLPVTAPHYYGFVEEHDTFCSLFL